MKQQDEVRKELESLSPRLLRLKEQEGKASFRVPPNYFRDLPDEVMRRIEREETSRSAPRRIRRHLGYVLAVAATGLLVIIAAALLRQTSASPSPELVALSEEEISRYINAHIDAFDLDLLVEWEEGADNWLPADELYSDEENAEEWMDELLDEIEWEELLQESPSG